MLQKTDLRFGVNYVPTGQWYFFWNDFDRNLIARDFVTIQKIGADHIRLQLIWPYFQPNPDYVSPVHLTRLGMVMDMALACNLDVSVCALDGWLSGYSFLPSFGPRHGLYDDPLMRRAQELYFKELSKVLADRENFIGFDLGNEINCCWKTDDHQQADKWLDEMLGLCEALCPTGVHVCGEDHGPWFGPANFTAATLARRPAMVALHCWTFFTGALDRSAPLGDISLGLPAAMTTLARAYAGTPDKPVWIQEFGATPEWMPAEIIPDFLEETVIRAHKAGATWFTWWCSHDINPRLKFATLEYTLGLIDCDQKIKPQGERFRDLAASLHHSPPPATTDTFLPEPPQGAIDDELTWQWLEQEIERQQNN